MDQRLPQPLDCANLAREWPKWKQQFYIYMIASNKNADVECNKIATFLWLVGERGVEIYNTLFPNTGDVNSMFGVEPVNADDDAGEQNVQRTLADVVTAFDGYCLPRKNVAMEAFKFNMIVQKDKQSFADFETALRTQLAYCEFECSACHASYSDRMLRDRIIIGVQDKKLQLKLLDGKDEPLQSVVETCKIFEAATENKQLLDNKVHHEMHVVVEEPVNGPKEEIAIVKRAQCYNCGQNYNAKHRQYCPARNVNCDACGRRGHFRKFCKLLKRDDKTNRNGRTMEDKPKQTREAVYNINWRETE
ncbi:uncharacterized protein LOC131430012 [Malaya genurostris]|uniref:uncharacterized protein LOC131430012 n=1 Tax=Malaya genurostris TaxID=325434 RepID=UPI0026F39DD0|nr:uncharacterized protein LOC131430012 [Malaya genurostris]